MATLNVFELTNEALKNARITESKKTSKKKKVVKESRKFGKKFKSFGKIPANKLQLESLSFVKEAEENDEVIDYTPEEDVVLVIDPEMEETPETEEEAEEAAEELIGDYVCKCSICGANYVCDCEDVTEDLEIEDGECPVCGETGEQIVVGEITPTEDSTTDTDTDEDEVVIDDDDVEDDEFVDTEDETDDDFADDDSDVDVNVNINLDDDDLDVAEEEDEYEESISRAKRRTAMRRESKNRAVARRKLRKESRKPVRRGIRNESRVLPTRTSKNTAKAYNFDDTTMNRMLTSFAKENYDNVRFVKINNAKCVNGRLTLEGVVVTKKGSKRSTKFVCENFRPNKVVSAKFREIGAFTESAVSKAPAFTINFKTVGNTIKPVALKYDYVVKEGRSNYAVQGRVMNESVKRNKRTK